MSPEVLRQEGYGEEVDWWSLGIIFFEVLLGGCPFAGETPEEVFQVHFVP
jgi:serine/threonine protein kinase